VLGQRLDVERQRRVQAERAQRRREAVRGQAGRMQAARQFAQLAPRERRLLARLSQESRGVRRHVRRGAQREVEPLAEGDQPLLGAVVEVASDPAALLVGGVEQPGT
jgi:hypothetical protein